MKIRKKYWIDSGIYYVKIITEDWSCNENDAIINFGEPEINLGGKILIFPKIEGVAYNESISDYLIDNYHVFEPGKLKGRRIIKNNTNEFIISDNGVDWIFVDGVTWNKNDMYVIPEVFINLKDNFAKIKTDSPFVNSFDSRTYPLHNNVLNAKNIANGWGNTITERINISLRSLMSIIDDYTREEVN